MKIWLYFALFVFTFIASEFVGSLCIVAAVVCNYWPFWILTAMCVLIGVKTMMDLASLIYDAE